MYAFSAQEKELVVSGKEAAGKMKDWLVPVAPIYTGAGTNALLLCLFRQKSASVANLGMLCVSYFCIPRMNLCHPNLFVLIIIFLEK